jgi:ribonuclease HI
MSVLLSYHLCCLRMLAQTSHSVASVTPMNPPTPHYLLRSEASRIAGLGRWRFVLRPLDGSADITAADVEPDIWGERLDLLTVVRALESLDQPSRVTLIRCTRYVEQGVQYGLAEWKDNAWRWEWFGQMVPVRDTDLWQRMDRLLQFHCVDCGKRRHFDGGHGQLHGPHWGPTRGGHEMSLDGLAAGNWVKCHALAIAARCRLWMRAATWLWQNIRGSRVQSSGSRA